MHDTGAYLTLLDADFVKRANITVMPTQIAVQGIWARGCDVPLAVVPAVQIGHYDLKQGAATVAVLDLEAIGHGTDWGSSGSSGLNTWK
jgi:hypothetical protein